LIGGARRGPLEDSGGMPGFEEIPDALADPAHPEHVEYSAWAAEMTGAHEPFDPGFLDLEAVNRKLILVRQRRMGQAPQTGRADVTCVIGV
jgi:hypothetical protein